MHFSAIFHQHHYSRHDQTGTQLVNPPDCWAQSCVSERKSLQTFSSIGKARHTVCNTVHRAPLCPLFKCIFNRQGWYRTGLQCMKCNDIPLFAVTLHRLRRHKCSLCSAEKALQCNRGATSHCCALSHYTRHKSPMVTPYTFQYITSYNITLHLIHKHYITLNKHYIIFNVTLHFPDITLHNITLLNPRWHLTCPDKGSNVNPEKLDVSRILQVRKFSNKRMVMNNLNVSQLIFNLLLQL